MVQCDVVSRRTTDWHTPTHIAPCRMLTHHSVIVSHHNGYCMCTPAVEVLPCGISGRANVLSAILAMYTQHTACMYNCCGTPSNTEYSGQVCGYRQSREYYIWAAFTFQIACLPWPCDCTLCEQHLLCGWDAFFSFDYFSFRSCPQSGLTPPSRRRCHSDIPIISLPSCTHNKDTVQAIKLHNSSALPHGYSIATCRLPLHRICFGLSAVLMCSLLMNPPSSFSCMLLWNKPSRRVS